MVNNSAVQSVFCEICIDCFAPLLSCVFMALLPLACFASEKVLEIKRSAESRSWILDICLTDNCLQRPKEQRVGSSGSEGQFASALCRTSVSEIVMELQSFCI